MNEILDSEKVLVVNAGNKKWKKDFFESLQL